MDEVFLAAIRDLQLSRDKHDASIRIVLDNIERLLVLIERQEKRIEQIEKRNN